MIATESYPPLDYGARPAPRTGLLEIHRSKISLHHANSEYCYPMVRLPHYLVESLAGLSTRIYQTVQDGALAFLVVVSSGAREQPQNAEKAKNAKRSFDRRLDMAEVAGSNPAEPTYFRGALVDRRLE